MGVNRCSPVVEHMELLQLTRAGDCEQSGNGALALGTPIAEHDLPPLHGRPEGSFDRRCSVGATASPCTKVKKWA